MKEFDLIKQYFAQQGLKRKDVILGIGDDCAIVQVAENQHIAITTDTLIKGVHFPEDTSAKAIGHKVVAVSLSDLAAVGAEPNWVSLALTLPEVSEPWVKEFCQGLFELCEYYNVQLIGGDTTQGPMSITVTAQGTVPSGKNLTRSGAKPGDWLYVTGNLGDAALALQHHYQKISLPVNDLAYVKKHLDFPQPRVLVGQNLREYASSAIDISDGLLADLAHICQSSSVGANVLLDNIPLSLVLENTLGRESAAKLALTGGDDYELLFSVCEDNKVAMETALLNIGCTVTCIGQLNQSNKITTTLNNNPIQLTQTGYQHFSGENNKVSESSNI